MFGFGKKEEEEAISDPPEGLEGLEYSPETTELANWLLVPPLDALEGEPDAGPLRGFIRRIFGG